MSTLSCTEKWWDRYSRFMLIPACRLCYFDNANSIVSHDARFGGSFLKKNYVIPQILYYLATLVSVIILFTTYVHPLPKSVVSNDACFGGYLRQSWLASYLALIPTY